MELIARQVISQEEGGRVDRTVLDDYCCPDSDRYRRMLEVMRERLGFTSLAFNRLDDMIRAVGIGEDKLCTWCWTGKE